MICDAALAADVPLEVNMGGIKRGMRTIGRQTRLVYPYRRFWEVAARKGIGHLLARTPMIPRNI